MENKHRPAFSQPMFTNESGTWSSIDSSDYEFIKGVTKREFIATKALQGLLAYEHRNDLHGWDELARQAVKCADALLFELSKE